MNELYRHLAASTAPLSVGLQQHAAALVLRDDELDLGVELLARHDLDPQVARTLAGSGRARLVAAWLVRPELGVDELTAAAADRRVAVRSAVAEVEGLPDAVYLAAATPGNLQVAVTLAENPSVPDEVLAVALRAAAEAAPQRFAKKALTWSNMRDTLTHTVRRCEPVQAAVLAAIADLPVKELRGVTDLFGALPGITAEQHRWLTELYVTSRRTDRQAISGWELPAAAQLLASPHVSEDTWQALIPIATRELPTHKYSSQMTTAEAIVARDTGWLAAHATTDQTARLDEIAAEVASAPVGQLAKLADTAVKLPTGGNLGRARLARVIVALFGRDDLPLDALTAVQNQVRLGRKAAVTRLAAGHGLLQVDAELVRLLGAEALPVFLDRRGAAGVAALAAAMADARHTATELLTGLVRAGYLRALPASSMTTLARELPEAVTALLGEVVGDDPGRAELLATLSAGYGGTIGSLCDDVGALSAA